MEEIQKLRKPVAKQITLKCAIVLRKKRQAIRKAAHEKSYQGIILQRQEEVLKLTKIPTTEQVLTSMRALLEAEGAKSQESMSTHFASLSRSNSRHIQANKFHKVTVDSDTDDNNSDNDDNDSDKSDNNWDGFLGPEDDEDNYGDGEVILNRPVHELEPPDEIKINYEEVADATDASTIQEVHRNHLKWLATPILAYRKKYETFKVTIPHTLGELC